MTITSGHVSAVRALLAAGSASPGILPAGTSDEDLVAIAALLTTAFTIAARDRFGSQWSAADVIRFIARMRTRYGTGFEDYDPALAEALLTSALNDPAPHAAGADPAANAVTQITLLKALTETMDEQALDDLLHDARVRASALPLQAQPLDLLSNQRRPGGDA